MAFRRDAGPETATRSAERTARSTAAERTDSKTAGPFAETDSCSPPDTEPAENPVALDETARDRFWCRGRPIDVLSDRTRVEGWGGTATIDGTTAVGSKSIRLHASADHKRAGFVHRFEDGVDLTGYDISVAARLESPVNDGVIVQLCAPDTDNLVQSVGYVWSAGWLRLDHGPTRVRGAPDLEDVRKIRIGMYVGEGRAGTVNVDAVRALPRRDRGLVVFTFDDNHITQYENAFPILREFDYPGAVGVIPWVVGQDDRIDAEGLAEMQAEGWEMASHPQKDGSLRNLPDAIVRKFIIRTKRWLVDHGFERGAQFIIWPHGQYSETALTVAGRYHRMGFAGANGVAGRITDPLIVSRVEGIDLERAKRMVDIAAERNQLCVLRYHRVGDPRSDKSVSKEELRSTVEHVATADVDVVSLSELWNEVSATTGSAESASPGRTAAPPSGD